MTTTCPRCGLTVEADDRRDAELWLRNHWDAYHVDRRDR